MPLRRRVAICWDSAAARFKVKLVIVFIDLSSLYLNSKFKCSTAFQKRCVFPELGPAVGYAVIARIRAAAEGERVAPAELWAHAESMPTRRLVVIQDMDEPPGVGSFWGEVNANVFRAPGCIGVVTNGGVRDLREMEALGFHAFAGSICVSHAYVRVVEVSDGRAGNFISWRRKPGDE